MISGALLLLGMRATQVGCPEVGCTRGGENLHTMRHASWLRSGKWARDVGGKVVRPNGITVVAHLRSSGLVVDRGADHEDRP